jgi:hypothetical protein
LFFILFFISLVYRLVHICNNCPICGHLLRHRRSA